MSSYEITPAESGITIEITGTGDKREDLLAAFGECQAGQCSCPTDEYDKVAAMKLTSGADTVRIDLAAKPGTAFDPAEIAACLDQTVEKAGR